MRKNISSGAPWEKTVGYSRAVKAGKYVFVAGTVAVDKDGEVVVVRSRIFLTNISDWQEVARAHGEVFADIRPAATMLEISKLIDERMLVEIEVDAIIGASSKA